MPGRQLRKKTLSRKAQEALSSPALLSNTPPPPTSSFDEEDHPFDLVASQSPTPANDLIEASVSLIQPEILPSIEPDQDAGLGIRKGAEDRLEWTPQMESTLFEALLEQSREGQKAASGWKNKAWEEALFAVLAVTPDSEKGACVIDKLKAKERHFKGLYRDWKWLLSYPGLGINPETGCVTTSEESWVGVIQVCTYSYELLLVQF